MPDFPRHLLTLDAITRLAEMRYSPTIEAFARAINARSSMPEKWFVDEMTFAILRDEGRALGQWVEGPDATMTICGVQIVEFDQPT